MHKELLSRLTDACRAEKNELNQYPPLTLAYIGDAVFEVLVRTMLIKNEKAPVGRLHKMSTNYVKAKAQSDIMHKIFEFLSPEEQDVVRRGRNAKSATIPKNADVIEYKYATGFEALLGYVYLSGDIDRLIEIFHMAVEQVNDTH